MKHKKNSRTFFTHGWLFFIFLILNTQPLWIGIPISIVYMDPRFAAACIIMFLFSILIPPLHWGMRFIHIKDGKIIVRRLFFALFLPIQHSVNVALSNVVFIEFRFIDGNSRGQKMGAKLAETPCLVLIKNDESIERIILLGYSNKQVAKIKHAILEENKEILVLNDWINKD